MWSFVEQVLRTHGVLGEWLVGGGLVLYSAVKFLPRPFLELTALITRNEQRRRLCLEMLRLRRKDAASLPSYLDHSDGSMGNGTGKQLESGKAQKPRLKAAGR